jgi:non-canonical purine NTP pyrophosphatase (RdgB/HAM1 family)
MPAPSPRLPISYVLLATAAFLVILPLFWTGNASGHDFEFHMFSWMEVLNQWRHGIVYPRWDALAHWGYGEARFVFYPPASWTLGAALGAVLPWKVVPGAYNWLVLTLSGFSMYRVACEWLPASDALFTAVFYTLNPYFLLLVYWRSAFAEMLAAALLPLLLLALLKLREPGIRPVLWLSLLLAVAWLTNGPAALMIHYSAAGLAIVLAIQDRSWKLLLRTGLAVLLGMGLASFYLLPAVYEERWVNIGEVLSLGVRPQDNFLFTSTANPDHNRFNLLVSSIALAEMALLGIAIWFSRASRATHRTLWWMTSVWGVSTALLLWPVSLPFWQYLPKFRFVQLPFRWLLCLNTALVVLAAFAFRRWAIRALAIAAMLAAVLIAGYRILPPWWDTADDIHEMSDAMADGTGNEGIDEYVPLGADPYEINKDLAPVTTGSGAAITAQVTRWSAEDRQVIVSATEPTIVVVRLFDYPAWKTTVNGALVTTGRKAVTGQLLVPVAAGRSYIRIHFSRTWDRLLGGCLSLISAAVFVAVWLVERKAQRARVNYSGGNGEPPSPDTNMNSSMKPPVLVATFNPGKLREFAGVAEAYGVTIASLPGFSSLPAVVEDGRTFEANARKKAQAYSLAAPGELVLADDSGLEIDALSGAPGVHSARYAADEPHLATTNSEDEANNARVLRELRDIPAEKRTARFVCVLAAARDGRTIRTFRGTTEGIMLDAPRGTNGFGYDPLFYFPQIGRSFAELSAVEKAEHSHRGAAFRAFLDWYRSGSRQHQAS